MHDWYGMLVLFKFWGAVFSESYLATQKYSQLFLSINPIKPLIRFVHKALLSQTLFLSSSGQNKPFSIALTQDTCHWTKCLCLGV